MTVLDAGCGTGRIAEYISDKTGAGVTGIDYIPEAVNAALARTAAKRDRLDYYTADLTTPFHDERRFDVILALDTIYFDKAESILSHWKRFLKQNGRIAVFYLSPDGSDISVEISGAGLSFEVYDLSWENWEHQQLKHAVVNELKVEFESENLIFIWKNLVEESVSSREPYNPEETRMKRYLYIIHR